MNSSFSKILPTLQLGWDSTSLGELKFCPRRYQYKMIENWAPKAESVHLRFGIEFHSALELYDNKRAAGAEHQEALVSAVKHTLASTWDENLSRPWTSDDPSKNRDTLVRSVVDYIDKFKDDSLETVVLANGKAAVELSFRFELRTASTGEPFLLCGHIDRLVKFNEKIWISDKKTTGKTINSAYFAKYSPDNQISLYSYAGEIILGAEVSGLIIDAVQLLVNETRFQRGIISRTPSQKQEWITDANYYLSLAEHFAANNYWPQNDKACSGVFLDPRTGELRYGCEFRPVCGSAPEVRQTLLELNFQKRVWDPLQSR